MMSFLSRDTITRGWRLLYIGFALVMAVLYDVFFWDHERGLGFLIFVALYVIGFTKIAYLTKQIHEKRAFLLLIPIAVMSVDVMLCMNTFVQNAVPWIVGLFLIIFSFLLTLENPHKHRFSFANIPLLRHIDLPFAKWGHMWRDLFSREETKHSATYRKIAIGLIVAIPLLLIFGALFAKADPIFADVLTRTFDLDVEGSLIWRLFRTGVFTLFLSSLFYVILTRENILDNKEFRGIRIDAVVIGTVLALVNALFLIFVIIQFTYLFGSSKYVTDNSINFADYARNGFFQLVWVIVIAAGVLVLFYHSAEERMSGALQALKVLLILQVGVVAFSALHRMNLYQAEYGYTVLRLYVEWFIYFAMVILLAAGFSFIVRWPFRNFFYISLILGVGALTVVSSMNVDRMIGEENVKRFLIDKKELDVSYLNELSSDVFPAVLPLYTGDTFQVASSSDQFLLMNIFQKTTKEKEQRNSWIEYHLGVNKHISMLLQKRAPAFNDFQKRFEIFESAYRNPQTPEVQPSCFHTKYYQMISYNIATGSYSFCKTFQEGGTTYLIVLGYPRRGEGQSVGDDPTVYVYDYDAINYDVVSPVFEHPLSLASSAIIGKSGHFFECLDGTYSRCTTYDRTTGKKELVLFDDNTIVHFDFSTFTVTTYKLVFDGTNFRLEKVNS